MPSSTRFFGRYLAPAEPAFYILVAAGCLAIARRRSWSRRRLAAGVVALSVSERVDHLSVGPRPRPPESHLGRRRRGNRVLVDGHAGVGPAAELLDDYLDLEGLASRRVEELPGIDLRFEPDVEQHGRANVAAFVAGGKGGRGLWIFRGPERRVTRAIRRLGDDAELVAERQSATLLSSAPARPPHRPP